MRNFAAGKGDRVQLDLGTQFTVSQVDGDVVIDVAGGDG